MDDGRTGWPATQAPADPMQFGAWLDRWLGRPMRIVALRRVRATAAGGDDPLADWCAQLAAYPGVWLHVEEIGDTPNVATLTHLAQLDLDVLLVCENALGADGMATPGEWRAAILHSAEDLNLFERMLVAWQGGDVTRAAARTSGFEDGFAPEQSVSAVLAILARETVARETHRRRGSSPPCYL